MNHESGESPKCEVDVVWFRFAGCFGMSNRHNAIDVRIFARNLFKPFGQGAGVARRPRSGAEDGDVVPSADPPSARTRKAGKGARVRVSLDLMSRAKLRFIELKRHVIIAKIWVR